MIQFLSKSSKGSDAEHYREACRARIRELAESTVEPSVALDGMPLEEARRDDTLTSAQPAGEMRSPATALSSSEPIDGFAAAAALIASSLTEFLSCALAKADRRAAVDRSELRAAQRTLTSLAGKVQGLSDLMGSLSEHDELVNRDYGGLAARLVGAEERLTANAQGLQGVTSEFHVARESQEEIRRRMEARETAAANLEQTVRSQAELVATRIVPDLTRISNGLQTLTQALDAQGVSIEILNSAGSRTDAALRSILERLERQAQDIQSVHVAVEAQAQRWGSVKEAATEFVHRLDFPAANRSLLEVLRPGTASDEGGNTVTPRKIEIPSDTLQEKPCAA